MSESVYFFLHANAAPRQLVAVLACSGTGLRKGANSFYVRGGDLALQAVWLADGRCDAAPPDSPAFEYRSFSATQRAASRGFCAWLCARYPALVPALEAGADLPPRIAPAIVATREGGSLAFHHFVQQGELGSLFVRYCDEAMPDAPLAWPHFDSLLASHAPVLAALRPALGDECWYTKWRPDLEMERKFTFNGIPDTWRLLMAFHDAIADGALPDFVPEIDREIQVWDYEQHIFEVLGANAESGYVAYIPQADGRMTVKRKWFIENSEVRRESLWGNLTLGMADIEAHVRTLTPEATRRLPSYRRKRFDAQFESLATGNIFGIYMDVCRTLDDAHSFSQCEVEYCRTRSFGELRELQQDFDAISGFVGASLVRWGQAHQQDLYSKLDFVREIADAGQAQAEPERRAA
ncbi:hypothetical protein QFZ42_001807 [Variovorax paradoxus]|uniref:hypothetical protein n=1 Tax=Variovorax paradoxus TaxID=34073 RepID=UPI00279389C6|nr:hypothetical protein [Variovorax paradoxus]MDQ0569973.1 hypothetical protein [Variovorax paradoxus]